MPAATRTVEMPRVHFIGSYAGTTAAQKIYIGFKPALIVAYNITDGDKLYIWSKTSLTTVLTIDTEVANESVAITQVSDSTGLGFQLPSDGSVNEDAKTYVFIAFPE